MSLSAVKPEINIFIHRRDLRIIDNVSLNAISNDTTTPLLHIFIFNPLQCDPKLNPFYNKNAIEFMVDSILSLQDALKGHLYCFRGQGDDTKVLNSISNVFNVKAISFNKDITPFARGRDESIKQWAESHGIRVIALEDYTLFHMNTILNQSNKPYEVFTPFYKNCLARLAKQSITVMKQRPYSPYKLSSPYFEKIKQQGASVLKSTELDTFYQNKPNPNLKVRGGRERALQILSKIKRKEYKAYDIERNIPYLDKTTKLAAYIKFGCISIREAFNAFKKSYGLQHGLVRELFWREFYAHATWHFPNVLDKRDPYKKIGLSLKWSTDETRRKAVMEGRTGIPLIDAAIRELLATGWMNNRLRMVVASFITKDLMMDWRIFERDLFARHLIDYDPSVNAHSWQGMAGVGIDAPPYWRIINPWRQAKLYDSDCKYIKTWVPELASLPASSILTSGSVGVSGYLAPIVDHNRQVQIFVTKWKRKLFK